MGRQAILTGAFSFTGAAVAAEMIRRGWKVHTLLLFFALFLASSSLFQILWRPHPGLFPCAFDKIPPKVFHFIFQEDPL